LSGRTFCKARSLSRHYAAVRVEQNKYQSLLFLSDEIRSRSFSYTSEDIVQHCEKHTIRWTRHILERLFQRNISIDDIMNVLANGEIIEQYPKDYPFPSCLVLGSTSNGTPLHIVCGSNGEELWLITAYLPTLSEWLEDFRTRKGETT
jgi:hypothetical protein